MKIFLAIAAFITIVAALPAPIEGNEAEAKILNSFETVVEANCQPGLDYCYQQIVEDLCTYQTCSQQPSCLSGKQKTDLWLDEARRASFQDSNTLTRLHSRFQPNHSTPVLRPAI
jgi:hypothetical protein